MLAAGRGQRLGGAKHLVDVGGRPMLSHVVGALRAGAFVSVHVVLAPGDSAGFAACEALGVTAVPAANADEGRAASVRAAVGVAGQASGLLIALADQPRLTPVHFAALVQAFEGADDIVRATYGGEPGTPVLFGSRYFGALEALRGSAGGREIIARHPDRVIGIALPSEVGTDVDTPEALEAARRVLGS